VGRGVNAISFCDFQSIEIGDPFAIPIAMIRKLKTGEYRLYSRKKNPSTGKRRNLGTFKTRAAAEAHERDVQYFKRH
jgi:hypothetical protein